MSVWKDVFVMIHGMVPDDEPSAPFKQYDEFWQSLEEESKNEISRRIENRCVGVQWGHPMGTDYKHDLAANWGYEATDSGERSDEKLFYAEEEIIRNRTDRSVLKSKNEDGDVLCWDISMPGEHWATNMVRAKTLLRGVGDVVYYVSSEGEAQVRYIVYKQILNALDKWDADQDSRFSLHVVSHSLGVTISHDFLYGLFCKKQGYRPGFISQLEEATAKAGEDTLKAHYEDLKDSFQQWRDSGRLRLGSLTSMASQLPLLAMRKQEMVNVLRDEGHLNAENIGIVETDKVKWNLFYEADDLLAFPSRHLYNNKSRQAIRDYQVSFSDNPIKAHTGYWTNAMVLEKTAQLLLANCAW